MRIVFLSLLIVFSSFCMQAQSLFYGGIFPTLDHSATLSNKWGYSLYYFGAFPLANLQKPDVSKDANFLLFYSEQALTFSLNNKISFTGSYVYQRANAVYDTYVNENRFYAQTTFRHKIKSISIKHRFRFDGRFIENRITNTSPFTHRARYLIGASGPVNEKLYFTLYEEAFFNTYANAGAFYGENWAYAAIGVKLNKCNKIEAGPLYITWNTGGNNWFNQYYLQLTWVSNLDFRKTKE